MESAVCLSSINESGFLPAEDILLNWPVIVKMFRRSRFSIRPNVGTAGRTAATPQEAPSSNQESSETPRDISESSTPTAVTDTTSDVTPSEKATAPGDGSDQNAEGASSSASVQRRKRFSVKPKVVPGRPSTLSRTSKSPAKAVAETPIETPVSDLDKPSSSIQTGTTATPQGLQSPRRRRGSEESRQPKVQPKPTPDSSEPSAVILPEESLEQTDQPTDSGKQLESKSGSQVKEVPPRPPDKEPVSLPDREAVEISERAKTLVSSKSGLSLSPSALSLSRLLNDPSDLQRLAKAQKLRELLRQEKHKEKKLKKVKPYLKEYTLDPTKMTMRDLIHYLPLSNPMTSSSEDIAQENETVLPPSPQREQSPETVQEPEAPPELPSTREDEEEMAEEEDDDALMVPQVKVAEDGSLIIDEESLTVEVQRAKGPNPAQDRDPIFERGSTTTYSSFRKSSYSKPWSSEETDMFYLAVSMVGTDFSMICQLFPHRARSEIKNKFKKEERANSWRVDKAFRERRKLDIEYFSKLLEKILEVQENRKKLKSLAKKNSPKKSKRKAKGKKAARTLSDVEEENEEDANEVPSLEDEEEGEKENENLCNEGGTPVSKPKRQSKRKAKQAAKNEEPNDKKKKTGEKSNEQGEACIPEDPEAALPEVQTTSDMSEKTEDVNASKDTAIKPAKLSRGRAPKPLLPLGRKWSKKLPPDSTKAKDTASDKEDESLTDGASKEQVNQDSSPVREDNERMSDEAHVSSEEEDVTAQPPRPTRYGRVPKPTKPLNYPAKEDAHTSASDATPASPVRSAASAAKHKPKCTAKRGRPSKQQSAQQSKKPKLVTLRSSRSEFSDDEEEKQQDQEEVEEEEYPVCSPGEDSAAPVFVPASLRSPPPVISEVEETMEELDILANMPDVLGLSQLCPDSSFELVQNETGTAEPCEHQLDLLVDVIDFLSSEHTEVNEDESYNEAAQTLLTIGNLTQLSAQNQIVTQDHTGTTSVGAEPTEPYLGGADQEENYDIHIMFGHGDTETSEIIATVEPQQGTIDSGDAPVVESSDQSCGGQNTVSFTDCSPQLESSLEIAKKHSPQTRKGRLSKVKPKPNLGGGSRTEQPKSQPDTSTEQKTEESNTEATNIQVTESPSAPEGTTPKILGYSPTSSIDDNSSTKAEHTEEPCVTQDSSGTAAFDQSASEHQSHSFTDAQFEPSGEQATRDMTFESSDQSFSNNLAASETSDSVPVHKGSPHCAAFITPVDDVPVSQKEEGEVASTCQIRRGRSQKVKPKPVLAQTTRTARSKPETTVEKDPSPAPVPQIHEKKIAEVEQEATCGMTPEKVIHSTSPTAAMIPLFDSGSALTPTKELSTTEEKRTEGGLDQSVSPNQILSEPSDRDTGSTSGSTDEKMATCDEATESSDKLATSIIESQVGQDSAPVQESSDHTPPSVTLVDDVPVRQKEESEVASTCQIKRGRSQKAKPKPNLAQTTRTVRSKPQTTKATVEKDPSPAPVPQIYEKTIVEVEPEATSSASPEKPSHSTGPAGALTPSFDSGSALTLTKELSTTEEKRTEGGLDQSDSQNQILTEPSITDTGSTSGSTDEKMATCDEATESSDKLATSIIESQVGQDSVPVQESSDHTPPSVQLVDDVPASQKEESEVASTCQIRRGQSQKAKPKPNLAQTTRTVRSKPQTTKATVEKDPSPAPVPQIHEKTIVEVEPEATSSASPEKPSHSTGPAAALTPSFDSGSALTLTKELSTTEEKRTEGGLDQSVSQNQILTEPSIRDTGSTSGSTDEKMATCDETTESSDNLVTSDSAVTKLQVGQDSAPVQESRGHPAPSVQLVDDVPASQKEESEVASSCQIRRGRSQKAKPKPNLAQTRTARSKPQTTEATVEKDPSPAPVPQTSPAAAMRPSFDSGSALTPTKELSTTEEKSTEGGLEQMATCDEATESSDKLATSVTESHVWQDSAPVQESSDHPTPAVTLVDDLPVSQKEESEVASTCQIIRGRSQKAKPKPNLAQTTRTVRSKPETTKATVETDPSPAPVPQIHEKTIEVEPEATSSTSHASVLNPLFDLGSTLTPTQELSATENKKTADALAGKVYSQNQNISETSNIDTGSTSGSTDEKTDEKMATGDAVSVQESSDLPASCVKPEDLPVSEKEEREVASTCQIRRGRAPKVKPKPNLAQTTRTPRSKPQTTKEPVMHVQFVETPSSPTLKPQSTEKTTADTEAPPICSISLPIQSTDTSLVSVQSLELCSTHKPTEESSTPMEHKTEVGLNAILEISEPNLPQKRRQFSKVKPNLASSTKTARTKLQPKKISEPSDVDTSSNVTSEPPPVDSSLTEVKLVEDFKLLTSTQCPLNTEPSSTKSAPAESEKTEGTSSDSIVVATSWAAENQYLLTDTIPESESSEMSTGDKMSNNDSVKTEPASQVSDSITASDPQSPEGGSTESKITSGLASNVYSITTIHPTESCPQSCPESDSEVKSQDAVQQCSGTRATHQTSSDKSQSASSTDRSQLELTDSSKSSKKGPQSRRGRLINPKPNLGRCSRPQQPQQVQNTTQAEADSGAQSEGVDASVSLNPVSELRPDIQDPVEGAVESNSNQESSPKQSDSHSHDAVSSLGCVTQAVDNSAQNTSTFGTEGTQSHPCLQLFPDLTTEQMPSDPDEPFFILSLSEIPVCSSGEVMDSAAEPLPYLPDGYAPTQPQSVPGESLAPQEDTSLSNVPVSMSVEESSEMGFLSVKDEGRDSAVHKDSVMENREDPQETVQPPTLPETVERTAKAETNLTKKRISGTGRRAKVQVKPNTTKKTQASKTVDLNTNQDSGLPGSSTQAEASDAKTTAGKVDATEPQKRSGDHVDIGKETPSVGKSPEDRSPRAQTGTIKTRGRITGTRKSGDFPSFLSDKNSSDLPCGEAASKGRKVKTPHTRKHSTSTPAASTSPTVTPTPAHTQQPEEPSHSTSSTTSAALTQCAAKVSAPKQSVESSATEVEPTSVSQYFLSDIFTEVE